MKIFKLFSLCIIFVTITNLTIAKELTGKQIIDEVSKRHDASYEYEVQKMILIDKDNNREERVVRRYSRKGQNGLLKYLLVFNSPAGVKGVALLTWQNESSDDDQWMYLPALGKKLKRVAKGGKRSYFMGTDYAFEDLVSEDNSKFDYKKLKDEKINGEDCYVVTSTPNSREIKKSSGYKFRKLFIRKDNFFAIRVDYFDLRGKFFKRQDIYNLEKVQGQMWRAKRAVMDNFKENHKTEILAGERSFDKKKVPKKYFAHRHITSGKYMRTNK